MPQRLTQEHPSFHDHLTGVIDLGSNSVRMVIYHQPVRVPVPLYNEKYYCALGKDLVRTGKLNAAGKKATYSAIAQFVTMARMLEVESLTVLATAALRDAKDGPEFIDTLEKDHGIKVRVISGKEEAELAAYGVIASIHDPHGLVMDMGGGSMEVARIHDYEIHQQVTTPLGVLRLFDGCDGDAKAMRKEAQAQLQAIDWLTAEKCQTLYLVGGSFRSLAKAQMKLVKYPLPILHEYRLSPKMLRKYVQVLQSMTEAELYETGIPNKRVPTIPAAFAVLETVLDIVQPESVMFSVSGIREGYLFSKLEPKEQREDALLASCTDMALQADRKGSYARELYGWMAPLFDKESEEKARLRYAACILSELAWTINPKFRASWIYNQVIQSSVKGVDHRERVALALALYHRYSSKWKGEEGELSIISESTRLWAKQVGQAMNLAFMLSAGLSGNLQYSKLVVEGDQVSLELSTKVSALLSDTVAKRVDGLGETFKALSSFLI